MAMWTWCQPFCSSLMEALIIGSAPARVDRTANLMVETVTKRINATAIPSSSEKNDPFMVGSRVIRGSSPPFLPESLTASRYDRPLQAEPPISKLAPAQTGDSHAAPIPTSRENSLSPCRNGHGTWPLPLRRNRRSACRASLCLRARRHGFGHHASPRLPARTAAHLSLLLQSRPSRRVQLLFWLRPLREGRLRDPGVAAKPLSAGHPVASWHVRLRAAPGLGAEARGLMRDDAAQRRLAKNSLSRRADLDALKPPITSGAVSYTHLTLPTIYSV